MGVQLFQGDCIQTMAQLPDKCVDLVAIDPPYSSGGTFATQRKASTRTKYTDDDANGAARLPSFSCDNMDSRSYFAFMREVLTTARSKTVDEGVCICFIDFRNLPVLTDAFQAAGWTWRGLAVWDKKNSRPQKGRYKNQCEYIVWGSNGAMPFDRGVPPLPGVYAFANVSSTEREHQTEKPVELMEDLLKIVPAGATVLDCFMGSGSTGVAAVNTGRKFIGIEALPAYFETAQRRIDAALAAGLE